MTDSALSGGGTILFPYFLFVIVIGLSGVIGEMSFGAGQSGRTGAYFHFPAQSVPGHAGKQYPNHVFFVAVLFAGISSLINLFEAPIAAMEQQFGLSRRISVSLIVALAFLIGICIQGIVADRMDFVSIYICPMGAGLAGIMFFWVYGWDFVQSEVRKGRRREPGKWFLLYGQVCVLRIDPACVHSGNRVWRHWVNITS